MIYEKFAFAINSEFADETNLFLEGTGMGRCFTVKLVDVNNVEYLGGFAQGNGMLALGRKMRSYSENKLVFGNMVFDEIDFDEFLTKTGLKLVKIPFNRGAL